MSGVESIADNSHPRMVPEVTWCCFICSCEDLYFANKKKKRKRKKKRKKEKEKEKQLFREMFASVEMPWREDVRDLGVIYLVLFLVVGAVMSIWDY